MPRTGDVRGTGPSGKHGGWVSPLSFAPVNLTNNELGWKTMWKDRRIQWNGAIYQEDWKNTIVEFFAPQLGFGNLTFVTNGPNYRVRGGELQLNTLVTEGLTVMGTATYNRSTEQNSAALIDNNPASSNFGKPLIGVLNVFGIPWVEDMLNTVSTDDAYVNGQGAQAQPERQFAFPAIAVLDRVRDQFLGDDEQTGDNLGAEVPRAHADDQRSDQADGRSLAASAAIAGFSSFLHV